MIKTIKDLVIEAIEKGATSTEEVQKSITNLPFEILIKIAPFSDTIKGIKEIQERSIGKVYDMIRTINEQVDEIADNMLERLEENHEQGQDPEKPKLKAPEKPKLKAAG